MNKILIAVVATAIGAAIGATELVGSPDRIAVPAAVRQAISFIAPTPTPHPLSVVARAAQSYDGSNFTLGRIWERTDAYTKRSITYLSGSLKISGVFLLPHGTGPFPLVVLNHGHIDTDIYTNGRGLRREQDYLARQGFAVLHTDYRNHAQSDKDDRDELAVRLAYAEDVINAVKAVQHAALPQVDATKVGMLGHSMGGGVTLNALVLQPELVDAAVLYAPVTGDPRDSYERWITRRPEAATRIANLYGVPEATQEFWKSISAAEYYDWITAPVAIFHGTADESVPLAWSRHTLGLLQEAGVDGTLTVYEGAPHEFTRDWPSFMKSVTTFFNVHFAR